VSEGSNSAILKVEEREYCFPLLFPINFKVLAMANGCGDPSRSIYSSTQDKSIVLPPPTTDLTPSIIGPITTVFSILLVN